jgi:hypothetical protein
MLSIDELEKMLARCTNEAEAKLFRDTIERAKNPNNRFDGKAMAQEFRNAVTPGIEESLTKLKTITIKW